MLITLYPDFHKRKNSTKQPTGAFSYQDVYLKEGTSVTNPVFIMDAIGNLDTAFNYCYGFGRYYFIDDIVSLSNSMVELHCSCDYLATYRSDIMSYTAFVERASYSYDSMVTDYALSQTQDVVYSGVAGSETGLDSTGTYIVPLSGKTGLQLVMFSNLANAGAFFNGVQIAKPDGTLPTVTALDNIFTTLGYQFFNIQDYMGAPYWLPLAFGDISGGASTLSVGMFSTTITQTLADPYAFPPITGTLNIPANYYGDFRSRDPRFSHYNAWLPGVGCVPLNSYDCAEGNLSFTMSIDIISGAVNYAIENSSGAMISSFDGSLKVPLPFGQIRADYSAPITNTISGAVSGGAMGGAAGAVAGAVTGAVSGISAMLSPQVSITNGGGNRLIIQDRPDIFVSVENYGSKQFPLTEYGRPLMENVTLSALAGYIKCGNASVPISGLSIDKEMVNSYLNTGFYLE